MFNRLNLPRAWLSWACGLCLVLFSALSLAAGRVEWKGREFKEREGGSWRLELAIFLARPPGVAHLPMKFEFEPTVYYSRDLVDGDKIIERKVPLMNRQPIIESVDVGFLDNNSGKVESRTRFMFKLTRSHGFEAGEYKVTVRDGSNGQVVGAAQNVILQGENEVVDRRAMVFSGEKKPKKKPEAEKSEASGGDAEKKADTAAEASSNKSSDAASEGDGADTSEESRDAHEPGAGTNAVESEKIKEKPGGCGCRAAGSAQRSSLPLAAMMAAGLLGLGVRRRAADARRGAVS